MYMKFRFDNYHQWPMFVIVSILVLALIWFGKEWYINYLQYLRQPQSHLFSGQLVEILDDNSLVVRGTHVKDKTPESSDYIHPYVVTVEIVPDTKFAKTIWYMPTKAELEKNKGQWNSEDLRKEQQSGSVNDFKNTQGLLLDIITEDDTFFENKTITAKKIEYVVVVHPQ